MERIRKYYKPIQPTVLQNGKKTYYSEIKPSHELENFVYCFWELKTIKNLEEPFLYRVVSDGCIDIFFELKTTSGIYNGGFPENTQSLK